MTEAALQYRAPFDPQSWQKHHEDKHTSSDIRWKRRRKRARKGPGLSPREHKDAVRPELYLGTLLRAAWAITEREDLTEYANTLADYMDVDREQLYSMSLAEFIDRYESARLTQEINDVYDEELELEDEEFLAHVKGYQGRVLNAED